MSVKITIHNDHFIADGNVSDIGYAADWVVWAIDSVEETPIGDVYNRGDQIASGHVKWDGCSNWDFDSRDCMLHACSRKGLTDLGDILAMCWDNSKQLLPEHWDESAK